MPQVIDGSKKNFNTTVVGASVTVIAQYAVRTAYNRQYYANARVYEFGNRPVWGENFNSFVTPLVVTYVTTRLLINVPLITLNNSFNYRRIQTPAEVYGYSTATKLFAVGNNSISIPVNQDGGGIGIVAAVPDPAYASANIYGVALITTATYAFAIEQLSSTQTAGLSFGTIISAVTSTNSIGNFGNGTIYVYTVTNSTSIIAIANTATVAPKDGTIVRIEPTGGTYTPPAVPALVADFLVVGGGGSGGNHNTTNANGGGGGGGVLYGTGLTLSGNYDVIVGAGGVAIANSTNANGNKGGNSSFGIYIAQGGGGGGSTGQGFDAAKMNGGSGGGSAYQNGGGIATQTTIGIATGYGNAGGTSGYTWTGAGGGGAGGAGVSGSGSAPGGDGGRGRAFDISGTWQWYAGGGGGGGNSSERAGDGYAGGGRGAGTTTYYNYNNYPTQGTVNSITTGSATPNAIPGTGGGGGGGSYWAANGGWSFGSGAGGSGIVIVRYLGSQRATGGTVTTVGSYTIHTFTQTGITSVLSAGAGVTMPTFRRPAAGPWNFTITGLSSTIDLPTKSVISVVPRSAGLGDGNTVYVTSTGTSSITVSAFGGTSAPTAGFLNAVYATGAIVPDTTINSITATSTTSWTFNVIGIKGTGNLTVAAVITATSVTGSFGAGNTVLVKSITDNTQIVAYATGTSTPIAGVISGLELTGVIGSLPAEPGDATYTTTGTFSWIAPNGVTSVSVVAVGGGGGGGSTWSSGGGGGGGLGWKNNIPVTPGQAYTVVVGSGGESTANAQNTGANLGGTSYFISTSTVAGFGAGRGGPNSSGGSETGAYGGSGWGGGYFGDGGGRGGNGAYDGSWNYGGAGAGGYAGRGADTYGGSSTGNAAPAGGGGGGGGWYSSTYGVPAGGGVGIFGQGASGGAVGNNYFGGLGGSGGENGRGGEGSGQSGFKTINGGRFGGGGGGSGTSYGGGWGGQGAVRIIWGTGRAFPTSNVTEIASGPVAAVVQPTTKSSSVGGPSYSLRSSNELVSPKVFLQNHISTIVPVTAFDKRRLTLEKTKIFRTDGYLNVNTPAITYNSSPAKLFNTGTAVTKFITSSSSATSLTSRLNPEINPSTTGTFVYRVTPITSSSWIFRIYNISSSTVSSLTATSIITATTSSGKLGSFGVGSTVTVSTVTSPTSIIAVAYGGIGSLAPTAGLIDSISIPGGTYTPPVPPATDINYSTPGTYTFIVPANATTLSAMAVGAGGAGDDGNTGDGGGGGGSGGSAAFFNNLSVTPGQTLTIVVGLGGIATATKNTKAPDGGLSSITFGSFTMTVPGGIGGTPYSTNPGAPAPAAPSFANTPGGVTTGGYAGGPGGAGWDGGGGGGGAGGLGGAGGNGSTAYSPSGTLYQSGFNGGAGAGGGGAASLSAGTGGTNSGYSGGAGGAGQDNATGGGGGGSATYTPSVNTTSGGAGNGLKVAGSQGGQGGFPGGGGGGSWDNGTGLASSGGNGFVRLVWAGTVQAYTGATYSGSTASTPVPTAQYQVAFNGTSQYLTTPSTGNYALGADFTVECWVYVTSNGNNCILTLGTGGTSTYMQWQLNTDRSLSWASNPSANWNWPYIYTSSAGVVPLTTWTHIAAVRNGSNFSMYVNGTSVYSTNSFSAAGQGGTLFIGTYFNNYNNDGSFFRGNISNFRIVRGAAVYTTGFTTPTAGLTAIANTALLICKSATFVDLSTNAVTITPVNSPTISVGTLSLTETSSAGGGTELFTPSGATKLLGIQFNGGSITLSGSYTLTTTGSLTYPTAGGVQNTGYATGWNMASNYLRINELSTVASNWSKTYVAWYKGTQTASGGTYSPSVPIFSDPANSIYWGLGISSGKICVSNATQNVGTTSVNTNNWFCLAWVVKSNYQVDAYVNGVKEISNVAVNSSYPGTSYIGNGYPYAGTEAPTALDAIQVISGELTAAQILEIYTAGISSGASSGVTLPTPLENNYFGVQSAFVSVVSVSSATIRDYNVGTLTNILSVTSDTTPGLITSVSGTNPWTLTIQQLRSTAQFTTGTIVRSTPLGGSFGGNTVIVTAVNSSTSITCIAQNGTLAPTTGTIVGIYSAGPDIGNYIGPVTGVSTLTNTSSYSVSFNGSSSFLQIQHTTNFNLNNLAWTAECWIRPDGDYSAYRTIFCKRVSGSGTTSYEGYLRLSSGVISFYNGTNYESSYTLTAGVWSHCAWVYTGSTLNIYVNGSLVYSVAISMGADNTEPFLIGNARGYSEYFNGYISNFRMVKFLPVYTGNFTPTTSPLTTTQIGGTNIAPISTGTYTILLTCQSTLFSDNSSYNNTITTASTVISVVNPFTTVTTVAPYTFTISGLTSTNAFIYGSVITATNMVGSLGTATVYVTSVLNAEQITCLSTATVTSGRIGTVSTTGAVISFPSVETPYETITLTVTGNITVTNNGTTDVSFFKTSGAQTWDSQAYFATGFTAPVTMEFFKQAAASDNSNSYAMIGWNSDPASDANYTSLDWAGYAYETNNYYIYHNGSSLGATGQTWSTANKFYIVYATDGYIRHYNGSKLLYSVFKGTGQTVYFDNSLYSPNGTFGGFSNVRIKKAEWLGTTYSGAAIPPVINYAPISTSTIYTGFGARSGPAASVLITGANASETPVIRQRFSAPSSDNGLDAMVVTITSNTPYAEGNNIGNQATEPNLVYTRDATVAYSKTRWVIPEIAGSAYGNGQAASVITNGSSTPSNYVRTANNAKLITATNRVTFTTPISVGVDSGAVGTIGNVVGTGPWVFEITGLSSTVGFKVKDILSVQERDGKFGLGNIVYVTAVNTGSYSIGCFAYGGSQAPTSGIVNAIYPTGELELDPTITSVSSISTSSWLITVRGIKGTSSYTTGSVVTITTSSATGGLGGTGTTLVVSAINSINQITLYASSGTIPRVGVISGVVPTGGTGSFPQGGDAMFITTGTFSWIAPLGITSVSVVAVGGGGGGGYQWSSGGGGGGGLGWKNNIPVVPGQSYTVVVGSGGPSMSNATTVGSEGGTSYFISSSTVAGFGGGRGGPNSSATSPGYGGGYQGDGGGRGGNGAIDGDWRRAGAGAGGYTGQGADSAVASSGVSAPAGGGGAAGGYYSSTYGQPAGGGVGIYGQGDSGLATGQFAGAGGGSGGEPGVGGEGSGQSGLRTINGGRFGGGGGGSGTSWGGGWGGVGAVRIIWGAGQTRLFPTTNAGTFTNVAVVATATTRSSTIGGTAFNSEAISVYTNRMPYPESIGIDRLDTIVVVDTITNDAAKIKLYAFNNLSSYSAGSRSVSNSLVGSENFYVAGTGTDGATVLSAYWF